MILLFKCVSIRPRTEPRCGFQPTQPRTLECARAACVVQPAALSITPAVERLPSKEWIAEQTFVRRARSRWAKHVTAAVPKHYRQRIHCADVTLSFALRTPPVLVANARVVDQRAPLHMHTFAIGSDRFCTATQVTQTLVRLGAKRRVRCRACVVVFRANGWYTNAIYRFRAMLCVNGISCSCSRLCNIVPVSSTVIRREVDARTNTMT